MAAQEVLVLPAQVRTLAPQYPATYTTCEFDVFRRAPELVFGYGVGASL